VVSLLRFTRFLKLEDAKQRRSLKPEAEESRRRPKPKTPEEIRRKPKTPEAEDTRRNPKQAQENPKKCRAR